MDKKNISAVLLAPICLLKRATSEEEQLFADKKEGWFYHFKLASGQGFIAHADKEKQIFTFRSLEKKLPDLLEIRWERKNTIGNLNYITNCQVAEGSSNKDDYEKLMAPRPIPAPYLTKMAIQHYAYHSMLDKIHWLQQMRWEYEKTKQALVSFKKAHEALLIQDNKTDLTNNLIQQKLKERRKNG